MKSSFTSCLIGALLISSTAFSTGGNGTVSIRLIGNAVQIKIDDPDGVAAWFAYAVNNNKKVLPALASENPAIPNCAKSLTKTINGILPQQIWVDYFDCETTPHRESWVLPEPTDTAWRKGDRRKTVSLVDDENNGNASTEEHAASFNWVPTALQVVAIILLVMIYVQIRTKPKS